MKIAIVALLASLAPFASALRGNADASDFDLQKEEALNWGKSGKPAMLEMPVIVHYEGLDVNDLAPLEQAYIEDAMLWSFNLANKDTDYQALTTHLESMIDEGDEDSPDEEGKLGRWSSRRRRGSSRSRYSWGCNFCGDDRRLTGANFAGLLGEESMGLLATAADGGESTVTGSEIIPRWEDQMLSLLTGSRFEVFSDVTGVKIEVDDEFRASAPTAKNA